MTYIGFRDNTSQESTNWGAFAVVKNDGSVISWGNPSSGGILGVTENNSAWNNNRISFTGTVEIPRYLSSGVSQIFSTNYAFAALKENGSVITWGARQGGGDSSEVSKYLQSGIVNIYSSNGSFAALNKDGNVITWGSVSDSQKKQFHEIGDVKDIVRGQDSGFIALKNDGSVVLINTKDDQTFIDSFNKVSELLKQDVVEIFGDGWNNFAALKKDGSVIAWGDKLTNFGDYYSLENVIEVNLDEGYGYFKLNDSSCVVIRSPGSIYPYFDTYENVNKIVKGNIIHNDGSVTMTDRDDLIDVGESLKKDVINIVANYSSFAALKEDGSVITWGASYAGGDSTKVSQELSNGVTKIFANSRSFAALKEDGSVITWGDSEYGGDSSSVSEDLRTGVINIYSNDESYAAIKEDGKVVSWGKYNETTEFSDSQTEWNSNYVIKPINYELDKFSVSEELSSGVAYFSSPNEDIFLNEINTINPTANTEPKVFLDVNATMTVIDDSLIFDEIKELIRDPFKAYQNGNLYVSADEYLGIDNSIYKFSAATDKEVYRYSLTGNDANLFSLSSSGIIVEKQRTESYYGQYWSSQKYNGQWRGFNYEFPIDHNKDNIYELTLSAFNNSEEESVFDIKLQILDSDTDEIQYKQIYIGEEYELPTVKDFDGIPHANFAVSEKQRNAYKYQGILDVNNDGLKEAIFTNKLTGRWVTATCIDNISVNQLGMYNLEFDFSNHGLGGTTRVVGIYIDPLVTSGEVKQFGPHDSQRRFQNDLEIDNLIVKAVGDYDSDGFQEVYWKTNDGTAYLRALMHDDGNIQYANYQSEAQMSDYLTSNGYADVINDIV